MVIYIYINEQVTPRKFVPIDRNPSFSFHFHTFHRGIKICSGSLWFLFPYQDPAKLNTFLVARKIQYRDPETDPNQCTCTIPFLRLEMLNKFLEFIFHLMMLDSISINTESLFKLSSSSSSYKSISEINLDLCHSNMLEFPKELSADNCSFLFFSFSLYLLFSDKNGAFWSVECAVVFLSRRDDAVLSIHESWKVLSAARNKVARLSTRPR